MSREATTESRVRSSTLPVILIIVLLLGFAILGTFLVLKTVGETWILDEVSSRDIAHGKRGVESLTARMDRMEMLAEIVGQAGQSQGSRARILSIVENLHGDPAIKSIRSFGYFRNYTGAARPQFYYRFSVRNGIQPDSQPPTADAILHTLLPFARTQHCLWQLNTDSGGRRFDGITCTLPVLQNNAVVGAAVLELHPDAFQDLVLDLQADVGYAFLVDETNRFVTFSYPDSVRLVDLDAEDREILETVTVQDMAGRDTRFTVIADALVSMNRQLVNNAASSSEYDADILEKIKAHDAATIGDRAQMLMAILMDPLATEGDGRADARMLQRRLLISDDFILGESALVYVFHVPRTYWKLVLVQPLSTARTAVIWIGISLMLVLGVILLIGIFFTGWYMQRAIKRPLKETAHATESMRQAVSKGRFQQLPEFVIPDPDDTEIGRVARRINRLLETMAEVGGNLQNRLEAMTTESGLLMEEVERLNDRLNDIKFHRSGDYFLASRLIQQLSGNHVDDGPVTIETHIRQQNQFTFKSWRAQIGGDLVVAHSLQLNGRPTTVFLNADASGKSIQGAGAILILAAIFQSHIERARSVRTVRRMSAEVWLHGVYQEMARVFAGFNGTALVSLYMAAIDDESGVLFGINAGHPATLLYRNGQLNRLSGEADFGRLGVDLEDREQPFAPMTVFALQPGDVLLTAPRVRENVAPDFAALVKQNKADASAIFQALTSDANMSDDISLVRVQWDGTKAESGAEAEQGLARAREMASGLSDASSGSLWRPVIDELQKVLQKDRFNRSAMNNLTRLYYRVGDYQQAAVLAEQYTRHHPDDTEFLLLASVCLYKSGRDDKARDFGERLKVRRPDHIENLQNLIFLANRAGDALQAQSLEAEIEAIRALRFKKAGALLN